MVASVHASDILTTSRLSAAFDRFGAFLSNFRSRSKKWENFVKISAVRAKISVEIENFSSPNAVE